MRICYIAPVETVSQNILEKAVSNAIQNTIVIPLKRWLLNGWIKFAGLSYWMCLAIATAGIVCAACGIPKGKKCAVTSIIFYIIIRMVNYYNGWM